MEMGGMAWPEFNWNIIGKFGDFMYTRMNIRVTSNAWNFLTNLSLRVLASQGRRCSREMV